MCLLVPIAAHECHNWRTLAHTPWQVHQHNSLLEHRGNVTAVVLSGAAVLVSASRDRTVNIHTFSGQPQPAPARKSYL